MGKCLYTSQELYEGEFDGTLHDIWLESETIIAVERWGKVCQRVYFIDGVLWATWWTMARGVSMGKPFQVRAQTEVIYTSLEKSHETYILQYR